MAFSVEPRPMQNPSKKAINSLGKPFRYYWRCIAFCSYQKQNAPGWAYATCYTLTRSPLAECILLLKRCQILLVKMFTEAQGVASGNQTGLRDVRWVERGSLTGYMLPLRPYKWVWLEKYKAAGRTRSTRIGEELSEVNSRLA